MAITKKASKKKPVEKPLTALDLAKDLLLLMKAKKFKAAGPDNNPNGRHYLSMDPEVCQNFAGNSLQKVMKLKKFKPCMGCAMGGLLLAFVDKRNQLEVPVHSLKYSGDPDIIVEKLKGIVSERQLYLIEAAFEVDADIHDIDSDIWKDAAVQFGQAHGTPYKRLTAILHNMMENKGIFIPPIEPYV